MKRLTRKCSFEELDLRMAYIALILLTRHRMEQCDSGILSCPPIKPSFDSSWDMLQETRCSSWGGYQTNTGTSKPVVGFCFFRQIPQWSQSGPKTFIGYNRLKAILVKFSFSVFSIHCFPQRIIGKLRSIDWLTVMKKDYIVAPEVLGYSSNVILWFHLWLRVFVSL